MGVKSFLKKVGKVAAIAAPIVAAPFTGGASLAAIGAGAGAAGGLLSGKGVKGALLGAGLGAIPGIGKAAMAGRAAQAGAGATQAMTTGQRLANIATQIPKYAGAAASIRDAVAGGPPGMDRSARKGAAASNAANQAAQNRSTEAQVSQRGPSADAEALANMLHAGLVRNYTPPSGADAEFLAKYGRSVPAYDAASAAFGTSMQNELLRRIQAGEPLTLSGIRPPSAQELADAAAARKASQGGGVGDVIQTGANLASLAPTFSDLYNQFGRRKRTDAPSSGNPAEVGYV